VKTVSDILQMIDHAVLDFKKDSSSYPAIEQTAAKEFIMFLSGLKSWILEDRVDYDMPGSRNEA